MDQFYEVAKAVFDAPELRLGFQFVERLNDDDKVGRLIDSAPNSSGLSFYLLKCQGLRSASKELLVLFDRTSEVQQEHLTLAASIARELDGCETITCVAERLGTSLQPDSLDIDMEIWQPAELYERILRTPEKEFHAELGTVASIQRGNKFQVAFQDRMVRVHWVAGRRPEVPTEVASQYFRKWLGARQRKSPILLLGERGSGKSWQLLRFAQDALELHKAEPWRYGPAFLVRLRDLVNLVEKASSASPVLCQYLLNHHDQMGTMFGGAATLGALFGSGHAVVCVDGFDEMDLMPTDSRVSARLTSLLLLLSKRTRFVLSCRMGHFSSLRALFNMQAWSDSTVGQTFEILELLPFDKDRKLNYISKATEAHAASSIRQVLGFDTSQPEPLQRALAICAGQPSMLAQLAEDIEDGIDNPLTLIENAILKTLLEFNLLQGRTLECYHTPEDEWVDLNLERRANLLCDLAWYMADREMRCVDLRNLPPRIRLEYRISGDVLERDLRSQTVLEPVISEQAARQEAAGRDVVGKTSQWLQFEGARDSSETVDDSLVQFSLRDENAETGTEIGESSVTGAFFLSGYLIRHLTEPGPFGELAAAIRLKYFGRVALGAMGAAMLGEMLKAAQIPIRSLGHEAWKLVVGLAKYGNYDVYAPSLRHLATNLALIGALSVDEARALDPWTEDVERIVRPPRRLAGYKMVLVPRPPKSGAKEEETQPFLLGVHEITNEQYRHFVVSEPEIQDDDSTVQGREWSVSRVTVAGSGSKQECSDNYRLTNEYHLFYWLATDGSSRRHRERSSDDDVDLSYAPPAAILDHPVTYVSWYATAAFCDWLSLDEALPRRYRTDLFHALKWTDRLAALQEPPERTGYRLATQEEWTWAACGGHEDLEYAWEAFPYYLTKAERLFDTVRGGKDIVDPDAWKKYKELQQDMKTILVDAGKESREVLYDEYNDYGVSGLVGNVREWCDDAGVVGHEERVILGATGFLGERTFNFRYMTSLYPRNTNPDVGFRIARSLWKKELEALQKREAEIAALPENPPEFLAK